MTNDERACPGDRLVVAILDGAPLDAFLIRGNMVIRKGMVDGTVVLAGGLNKPELFAKAFPEGTRFVIR